MCSIPALTDALPHRFFFRANGLQDLRTLVIQAGQLEQGLADHRAVSHEVISWAVKLTDHAAAAFYGAWAEATGAPADGAAAHEELQRMRSELEAGRSFEDALLTLKIPEGFEFKRAPAPRA